ncbi:hypothetical protein GCM10027400_24510 [Pseudoxanthomonas daejeonensis]
MRRRALYSDAGTRHALAGILAAGNGFRIQRRCRHLCSRIAAGALAVRPAAAHASAASSSARITRCSFAAFSGKYSKLTSSM